MNFGILDNILHNIFKKKLLSFKKLPKNWDSYQAEKIDKEAIKRAIRWLDMIKEYNDIQSLKFISPIADGGILFELDFIEIEFKNGKK